MAASGLGITVLPAPSRRIALAWRKSFAHGQPAEVLAQAIAQSKISGIRLLR